jgi:hypothetical protein
MSYLYTSVIVYNLLQLAHKKSLEGCGYVVEKRDLKKKIKESPKYYKEKGKVCIVKKMLQNHLLKILILKQTSDLILISI